MRIDIIEMSANKKIKLSLSNISTKKTVDPLQRFYASIKSQQTRNSYRKTLREFLDSVDDFIGTFEQKVKQFYDFALENTEGAQNLLEEYAIQIQKRSKNPRDSSDYLNPSAYSNKFKGIKKFCKINHIPILWDSIDQYEPEHDNIKPTRGFTTEEMRTLLDNSTSVQTDFAILLLSSSSARAGEIEELRWEHVSPIYQTVNGFSFSPENTSKIVCACVIIYAGTKSEYRTLISIEAWEKLESLRKQWTRKVGRIPNPSDFIFLADYNNLSKYAMGGIRKKLSTLVRKSKIQIKNKDDRRYDVPVTHGFRKRWNKIMTEMENQNESHANHIRKERLLGHQTAISKLESSYFYNNILESVPLYLKAMPHLMISEEYRAKIKLLEEQKEKTRLEQEIQEKNRALDVIRELKIKVDRIQRYQQKT